MFGDDGNERKLVFSDWALANSTDAQTDDFLDLRLMQNVVNRFDRFLEEFRI